MISPLHKRGLISLKKKLTLAAAVVLLLTTVFVLPLTNVVREQEDDKTIYKSALNINENNNIGLSPNIVDKDKVSSAPYNNSDTVKITVELTEASLSEEFLKNSANDIPAFLETDEARTAIENIQSEQDSFRAALSEVLGNNAENVKATTVVMNSVTFSCPYEKLAEIKKLKFVKNAYTSVMLKPLASSDSEAVTDNDSSESVVPSSNKKNNFSGSGTVAAVLDTGFDIDHDALSVNPENEKYSQDQFMNLLATLNQCIEGDFSQTDLYNNQKVLFSYDYYDNDNDASTVTSSHGTMSAGIIAGNQDNIPLSDNAYDSQLLLMKCSSDTSEDTDTSVILLALEDSVKLGADVINISYGSNDCLDSELAQSFGEMFERIFKSGTAIVMPAGNFGRNSFTKDSSENTNIIGDGTVSPMASLSGVLAVSEAEYTKVYSGYFICNGKRILYSYPKNPDGKYDYSFRDMSDGSYEYVVLGLTDSIGSYLNGKIVFLDNDSDVNERIKSAGKNGAVAAVIFGDKAEALEKSDIPCAFVSDAKPSSFDKTGKLTFSSKYILETDNKNSGKISATASFGVSGSLTICPEIAEAAPNCSSTLNNRYGTAEGSSFSSALTAGKIAVLKQYINNDERFSEYTPVQKNTLIYSLIMNTADIITNNGTSENVRIQGAGLFNLNKAIASDTFISVNDGLPKLELGSSADGEYSSSFEITNISDSDIALSLSSLIMTESFDSESGTSVHTEIPTADRIAEFKIDGKTVDNVTVKASEKVNISFSIKLNPLLILDKLSEYKNGTYLDGYVSAAAADGTAVTAPILGFIGDYCCQSAFDSFIYDEDKPLTGISSYVYLAENNGNNKSGVILGYNKFLKEYDEKNISFNSKTFSEITGCKNDSNDISLYLRSIAARNVKGFKCTVKNESGSVLFETEPHDLDKFTYGDEITSINTGLINLSDGKYTLTIGGEIEELPNIQHEQSRTFSFSVDSKRPNNTSYKTYYNNDRTYLEVIGKDNNAIQGFDIYVAVYNGKTGKYEYSSSLFDLIKDTDIPIYGDTITLVEHHIAENGSTVFTYDITKLKSALKRLADNYNKDDLKISQNKVAFAAVDYAYNYSEIKLCDTVVYNDLTLKFVDKDGKPISGVAVEINKRSFTSDKNGKIIYANLPAGDYKVKLTKIPNKLSVKENPFIITIGDNTSELLKTVTLMPEGTYQSTSSDSSTASSPSSDSSLRDSEQKPGNELNPKEPQPEDAAYSVYALIMVAALLAISITAFIIGKKKFH